MATNKKAVEKTPRTMRDALAAQVLGDIDALLDKSDSAAATITAAVERMEATVQRLQQAGESYNQAVLAANMRSKQELMAYLKTISTSTVAATADEQREIVRKLLREAITDEIEALKKAMMDTMEGSHAQNDKSGVLMAMMWFVLGLIVSAATISIVYWASK